MTKRYEDQPNIPRVREYPYEAVFPDQSDRPPHERTFEVDLVPAPSILQRDPRRDVEGGPPRMQTRTVDIRQLRYQTRDGATAHDEPTADEDDDGAEEALDDADVTIAFELMTGNLDRRVRRIKRLAQEYRADGDDLPTAIASMVRDLGPEEDEGEDERASDLGPAEEYFAPYRRR